MASQINLAQSNRAEKEQKLWLLSTIICLAIGVGIIALLMFVVEQPFEKRYPADHYWLAYMAISALGIAILGITKFFRLDEKNKSWYHAIISILEVNMWIAIMSLIIVGIGLGLTFLIMV